MTMGREDLPGQLAEVKAALNVQDLARLRRAAHTLKGTLATFSARRAEACAQQMERLAQGGDAAACVALLPRLETEVAAFLAALA